MFQQEFQPWHVFPLGVMGMSCCVRKTIWNAALRVSLQVTVNEIICFLSRIFVEGRKIFSNKVLCSELIDKSLFGLVLVLEPFLKTLSLQ